MKKAKITFLPIDGTGALHIDFQPGPFGDATEARQGEGVGFFSASGKLMGVTFDDVNEKRDHQIIKFERHCIEVKINQGKVLHSVSITETKKRTKKSEEKKAA